MMESARSVDTTMWPTRAMSGENVPSQCHPPSSQFCTPEEDLSSSHSMRHQSAFFKNERPGRFHHSLRCYILVAYISII